MSGQGDAHLHLETLRLVIACTEADFAGADMDVQTAYLSTGDVGVNAEYEERTLGRLEALRHRRYVSVFGDFRISRRGRGTQKIQSCK